MSVAARAMSEGGSTTVKENPIPQAAECLSSWGADAWQFSRRKYLQPWIFVAFFSRKKQEEIEKGIPSVLEHGVEGLFNKPRNRAPRSGQKEPTPGGGFCKIFCRQKVLDDLNIIFIFRSLVIVSWRFLSRDNRAHAVTERANCQAAVTDATDVSVSTLARCVVRMSSRNIWCCVEHHC